MSECKTFVFNLSKFLGFYPFTYRDGLPVLARFPLFRAIVLCAIYTIVSICTAYVLCSERRQLIDSNYRFYLMVGYFFSNVVLFPLAVWCIVRYRNSLVKAVECLLEVDRILHFLSYSTEAPLPYIISLTLVLSVMNIVIMGHDFNALPEHLMKTQNWFMATCCTLTCAQYVVFVDAIHLRLKAMSEDFYNKGDRANSRKLLSYTSAIGYLSIASSHVCKVYSWQILCFIFVIYIRSVLTFYDIIIFLWEFNFARWKPIQLFVVRLQHTVYSLALVWEICRCSERVTSKVHELNALIYQAMLRDKTNNLVNEKKLMLHFTMNENITFSANGFFNLDFSLIYTMNASLTSYLVILIQFQ